MRKLLIVAPSWVGDCMLTQPLLVRLKQRFPESRIDLLAPPWMHALFALFPEVDQIIPHPFRHGALQLGIRYRLGRQLAETGYDAAYVLPNSLKSALVPFFAGIPRRIGYIGEMRYGLLNDVRKLDQQALPLMVERFAWLAEERDQALPRPLPPPRLHIADTHQHAILTKLGLTQDRPIAAFCPGAEYGPAKRWPTAHYAALAQHLVPRGYAVWLFGSGKDRPVAEEINTRTGGLCVNLCGRTDLGEAAVLLSCASLVVSNDSGLMHIAAALDRPLIALFGSSSPEFTPPLSERAQVLRLGLPCSPCFKRECPLGHLDCLNQLTPDRVLAELDLLLKENP